MSNFKEGSDAMQELALKLTTSIAELSAKHDNTGGLALFGAALVVADACYMYGVSLPDMLTLVTSTYDKFYADAMPIKDVLESLMAKTGTGRN